MGNILKAVIGGWAIIFIAIPVFGLAVILSSVAWVNGYGLFVFLFWALIVIILDKKYG